jgi:hypothetical protein
MKNKEQNLIKKPSDDIKSNSTGEEHIDYERIDRELYLFMRGGFSAK